MKANLVDMLKAHGFAEVELRAEDELIRQCNGLILQREWSQVVEVAFRGRVLETYAVRVLVNRNSGICLVRYRRNGREYKSRWYDTVGKRTYNAIVETARCAGYEV